MDEIDGDVATMRRIVSCPLQGLVAEKTDGDTHVRQCRLQDGGIGDALQTRPTRASCDKCSLS